MMGNPAFWALLLIFVLSVWLVAGLHALLVGKDTDDK